MNDEPIDPTLAAYIELCQRTFERMERDGSWPWRIQKTEPDSTLPEDLVDSESSPKDI